MPRVPRWLWKTGNAFVVAIALVWRRMLPEQRVIAVTGSSGKTTAKECLRVILSEHFPIVATAGSDNGRRGLPRLLLRARRSHRFVLAEVGILKPGRMWRSALLLRPDIVVITSVARQHMRDFQDLETVAREKAKLLHPLSSRGFAVLNGDDPRVAAMSNPRRFPTIWFGTSPQFDVWASDVSFVWPGRLEFTVHAAGASERVRTQFVGAHWVPSVLAAIATALRCGVTLRQAAEAVAAVVPYQARMQPVALPSGAIMLRDENNGTVDTFNKALEVLRTAKALRRVAVIGTISDHPDGYHEAARWLGRELASAAEVAIFVGEPSRTGSQAAEEAGMKPENLHWFPDARSAAGFLRNETRCGDLVLLKGTWDDHFPRIYYAQLGTVECWREHCLLNPVCGDCRYLGFRPDQALAGREGSV